MFNIIEFENVNSCNFSILPLNALRRDTHARIQEVFSEGSKFDFFLYFLFFQLMRGERIKIPLLTGHHGPASETPFKRRFAGVTMMTQH